MADPVLTVERKPVTEAVARYPLATKTGLHMLQHLINGDRIWSGCTKPQRRVLDELCRPVIARLLEAGQLGAGDMPLVPIDIHTVMRTALIRRGLVDDASDRITGKAVYAWYWAVGFKEGNRGAAEAESREVARG